MRIYRAGTVRPLVILIAGRRPLGLIPPAGALPERLGIAVTALIGVAAMMRALPVRVPAVGVLAVYILAVAGRHICRSFRIKRLPSIIFGDMTDGSLFSAVIHVIYFFSLDISSPMFTGLPTCSFMPAAKQLSTSSLKTLAVIATMGISFALGETADARMRRVAS